MSTHKNTLDIELKVLASYKLSAEKMFSPKELYAQRLLEFFPIERDLNLAYLHPNTFTGSDERDYLVFHKIFNNKNWDQVNLNVLYEEYVQFLMLDVEGELYYMPAFLNFFYDLKSKEVLFFDYFLGGLADGITVPSIDEIEKNVERKKNGTFIANYHCFEKLTPEQAKLVAVFLVNVANLLPSDSFNSKVAQRALTNYWGHFLLF